MATDAITSAANAGLSFSNLGEQSRTPVTTLDQDDFLKLLVTQMTTQDPMKPMEDLTSFSQLASFSALEQSKATQASMAVIQANSMLGHFVEVTDDLGQSMIGQVGQVLMIDGEPQLVVDGERFKLSQVTAISTQPFLVDDGGNNNPGGGTTPGTTNPNPSNDPRLGPAPGGDGDPRLGLAPGGDGTAVTGPAPISLMEAILGGAPRP